MARIGMAKRIASLSSFVRITQLPFLLRRVAGLPALQREAFHEFTDTHLQHVLAEIASHVRGVDYRPAIFVHGVLPRSGTNYLADAIALHPHTAQNPGELWEFPLLYIAGGTEALQHEFQFMFPPNARVMCRYQMLAHLAAGWLCDLQSQRPDKHMLFKSPHMQNSALFSAIFPRDKLLILIRDGRDVLQSSLATFGNRMFGKSFTAMATEWDMATRLALDFMPSGRLAHENIAVVRYEDLVLDGRREMQRVLGHCALDADVFDWSAFDALPLRGSSTNPSDMTQKWQQVPRRDDFNPLGRWRDWPKARKSTFKKCAGETLIASGYAQDLDW